MKYWTALILSLLAAAPAADAPLFSADFAKAELGKPSDKDFLVLAGTFAVTDIDGERLLELEGRPLDSFGALFGPAPGQPACNVSARIWGDVTGKRFPEFGIGSNDTGGYKLWLMPRQKKIAIRKADATVATAAYERWEPKTWTQFRLQVVKAESGTWMVQGKVWVNGTDEPKEWSVSFEDKDEPTPGRASLWGNPYSGQPIRFDDLRVDG
jgi:hypothetical protein